MRVKTSVTLERTVLQDISLLKGDKSRSEFIERAVTDHIRQKRKEFREQRDIEIINNHARYLNAEAEDALLYQNKL
ncbi:MAG: hypothetical protein JSR44_06935 [Spirochaetes bacterium]|nr:hypothetical protein [Spirochaetota bacterium]